MTTANPAERAIPTRVTANDQMPFMGQVVMLTSRYLKTTFRAPAAVIPGFIISVFFLFVYQASLGNAAGFLPGLAGKSYLAFILPVSVVSSALSGAGLAGQSIVQDIASGYFDKLMLTPVSRAALLLGAIISGAIVLGLQTAVVTLVGVLLGLNPPTGVLGVVAIIAIAILLGTSFAGLTVGVGLRSGSPAATQGASFLFFPFTFLTATFVPIALLSGWIKVAAQINPITYILQAMRTILLDGWTNTSDIALGVGVSLLLGVVTFAFAMSSLRARTARK